MGRCNICSGLEAVCPFGPRSPVRERKLPGASQAGRGALRRECPQQASLSLVVSFRRFRPLPAVSEGATQTLFAIRKAMHSNSNVSIDPQPSVSPGQALSADNELCQGGTDGGSPQARHFDGTDDLDIVRCLSMSQGHRAGRDLAQKYSCVPTRPRSRYARSVVVDTV